MENCITLSNQQASTTVTASVSTYSLWARSGPSPIGTFVSLPDSEYIVCLRHYQNR